MLDRVGIPKQSSYGKVVVGTVPRSDALISCISQICFVPWLPRCSVRLVVISSSTSNSRCTWFNNHVVLLSFYCVYPVVASMDSDRAQR